MELALQISKDIVPDLATANIEIANSYKEKGYTYKVNTVPVRTLSHIWEEYVDSEVHFLKIDVEGFEIEAIMLNEKLNVKKDDEVFLAFKVSDVIISKVLND